MNIKKYWIKFINIYNKNGKVLNQTWESFHIHLQKPDKWFDNLTAKGVYG